MMENRMCSAQGHGFQAKQRCNLYKLSTGVWSLTLHSISILSFSENPKSALFYLTSNLITPDINLFPDERNTILALLPIELQGKKTHQHITFPNAPKLHINAPQSVIEFSMFPTVHDGSINESDLSVVIQFELSKWGP